MERLVRHDGESRDTDRLTWSRHRRIFGGQGVGHEEPFRSPESNDGFGRKRTGRMVRISSISARAAGAVGRRVQWSRPPFPTTVVSLPGVAYRIDR